VNDCIGVSELTNFFDLTSKKGKLIFNFGNFFALYLIKNRNIKKPWHRVNRTVNTF
jgi:hypothetical protein